MAARPRARSFLSPPRMVGQCETRCHGRSGVTSDTEERTPDFIGIPLSRIVRRRCEVFQAGKK